MAYEVRIPEHANCLQLAARIVCHNTETWWAF